MKKEMKKLVSVMDFSLAKERNGWYIEGDEAEDQPKLILIHFNIDLTCWGFLIHIFLVLYTSVFLMIFPVMFCLARGQRGEFKKQKEKKRVLEFVFSGVGV